MKTRGRSRLGAGVAGLGVLILAIPGVAWGKSCVVGSGGGGYAALALALKDGCDDIEIQRDLPLEDPVTLAAGAVTIWASKPRLVPPFAVPKGAELHLDGVELVGRLLGTVTWDHGCDSAIGAALKRFGAAPKLLAYPSLCVAGGTVFLEGVSLSPAVVAGVGNAGIVVQAGELYGNNVTVSGYSGMPAAIVGPNPDSSTPILNLSNGAFFGNVDTAILSDHGSVALDAMNFRDNDARTLGTAADVELDGGTLTVTGGSYTNPGVADGTPASAFTLNAASASMDGVTISGYRAASGSAIRAKEWSSLWLVNLTLDDLAAYFGGAIALENPSGVTIESSTATRTNAVEGGVVWVSGGSASSFVELLYDDFTAGFADGASGLTPERGAILSSVGPTTIRISGGGYGGDPAVVPRVGGAVYVDGAARFETNGTFFHDFSSVDEGGTYYLGRVEDAYLGFSRVDDSAAGGLGGAVFASEVAWLAVEQNWFIRGSGYEGGHLALVDTSFDVVGGLFAFGSADQHGGSVYVAGEGSPQRLLASRFCGNASAVGGAAAFVVAGPTGTSPSVEISHTAFLLNADPLVAAVKVVSGTLAMQSNTFVGQGQEAGGDLLIAMYDNPLSIYDSLLLRADYGVHLGFRSDSYDEGWVNDWQVNHAVAVGDPKRDRPDAPNHSSFDPRLRGDLGVGGEGCFFSVMPAADSEAWTSGSPLEGGSPAGLGVYGNDLVRVNWDLDFDGTNGFADCDDGDPNVTTTATGPIPHPSGLADVDQDGAISEVCGGDDCDDLRADVGPAAFDAPGDGFDANCDGIDGGDPGCPDGDGDGHRAELCGGDDCDDAAAGVFPQAPEIDLDGVDQDCDGVDGTPWAVGGGGCVVGGGDPGLPLAWIGGLLLLGARRRTRSVV